MKSSLEDWNDNNDDLWQQETSPYVIYKPQRCKTNYNDRCGLRKNMFDNVFTFNYN